MFIFLSQIFKKSVIKSKTEEEEEETEEGITDLTP